MLKKKLALICAIPFLLIGCSDNEGESGDVVDKENFESEVQPLLTAEEYIESITYNGDEVTVNYYEDYAAYEEENPNSTMTEEGYEDFWARPSSIEETIFQDSPRQFELEPNLNKINYQLPYQEDDYSYSVERSEVEEYTDLD